MDKMTTEGYLFLAAISLIVTLVILYYIIKGAVKSGSLSAYHEVNNEKIVRESKPENEAQEKLKKQFLNGDINFHKFKYEWNQNKN